jgi:ATP-dependent protease HslVU (ClpYQ) peptidase subunit
MSVIVWDGKTLAADCQVSYGATACKVSKIRRLKDGTIIASCGKECSGELMAQWYEQGADLSKYPVCQTDEDDWSRLIVVLPNGQVFCYEKYPVAVPVRQFPMAWGSGQDFALGALAMGADARKAVEIASQFSTDCGLGIEAFDIGLDKKADAYRSLSKSYALVQERDRSNGNNTSIK